MQLEPSLANAQELAQLGERLGADFLRRRLELESRHSARVRGAAPFFHLENSQAMAALLRAALKLAGLHDRGRRNVLRIRVRHNAVVLATLPAAFAGYTLLHLSDLHLDLSEPFLLSLIEHVRGLDYDLCVLTGDFRFRTFGSSLPALAALARLRPHLRAPVYAILGNHDSVRMVPGIEALDMRVLLNEAIAIERNGAMLHLAGIDDPHYFRTHDIRRVAKQIPRDACAILLSHAPEPYEEAARAGFALMLCGHTHGGQICLPGGVPIITESRAPRAFAKGAWRFGNLVGYTSVGCGSSIVDVRLNCPPEVTLHHLSRATA
jgi:predicted MPP superfamily phosphohydrolase